MNLDKITSAKTLKSVLVAVLAGAVGSSANRLVSAQSASLQSVVAQLLMAVVGAGGFFVLENKKKTVYQALKFIMLGLGFQSVNALIDYAGVEVSAAKQAAIANGVKNTAGWDLLQEATTPTTVTGLAGIKGLGNPGMQTPLLRQVTPGDQAAYSDPAALPAGGQAVPTLSR